MGANTEENQKPSRWSSTTFDCVEPVIVETIIMIYDDAEPEPNHIHYLIGLFWCQPLSTQTTQDAKRRPVQTDAKFVRYSVFVCIRQEPESIPVRILTVIGGANYPYDGRLNVTNATHSCELIPVGKQNKICPTNSIVYIRSVNQFSRTAATIRFIW